MIEKGTRLFIVYSYKSLKKMKANRVHAKIFKCFGLQVIVKETLMAFLYDLKRYEERSQGFSDCLKLQFVLERSSRPLFYGFERH